MPNYQRDSVRAVCKGLQLTRPVDLLDEGKFPFLSNVRSYTPGEITSRLGLLLVDTLATSPLHSAQMIQDLVPGVTTAWAWLLGAGDSLYLGQSAFGAAIDSGYSGDPISMMPYRPEQSPEPWVYLADRSRMRKVRLDGTVWQTGITPPAAAPTVGLGALEYLVIDDFEATTGWTASGAAAAPGTASRVSTTISKIVYDSGTDEWCSIAPTDFSSAFLPGMRVLLGGAGSEMVEVTDVKPALDATTIDSISYDAGTAGWCSIVPASGEWANPIRNQALVDGLITLGGTETVRIQAVIRNPTGSGLAFRCYTTSTFAASNTLVGVASLRVFALAAHAPGDAITDTAMTTVVTIPTGGTQATGILTKSSVLNLASIGDRTIQPDDLIHLSIKLSDPTLLVEGRVYFDVDPTNHDFLHNALWYAFRPSDLSTAVAGLSTLLSSGQIKTGPGGGGRQGRVPGAAGGRAGEGVTTVLGTPYTSFVIVPGGSTGGTGGGPGGVSVPQFFPVETVPQTSTRDDRGDLTSGQLGTGVDQWLELTFRVGDLIRTGPDTTRTLADVDKVRIALWISGAALQTLTVSLDSWWIGGTFGPDVGATGSPYFYCYRARSSVTGAKSNPSPPTRAGVIPHRQEVVVNLTEQTDPQVDLLDVFRLGGALTGWHWVGAAPNETAPFYDVWMDDSISGNETLPLDDNQPWPTVGTPKSGVVNVVGSSVTWVSGDVFNVGWLRNTLIQIAGQTYSLYAPPSSTTRLEINESAGTLTAQPFTVQEPLFAGQSFAAVWGPWDDRLFACGDPLAAGTLYCSKSHDPDTATLADTLEITAPSEPLMNGGTYDGRNFVFSNERLFAIYSTPQGSLTPYSWQETPVGQGLGGRWFFCLGPVVYFGNRRGIFATDLAQTISLTDADLAPLFYREGSAPQVTNGIVPPDFTRPEYLRLSTADGWLWFDYYGVDQTYHTLACDLATTSWYYDTTTPGSVIHAIDDHLPTHRVYVGGTDGGFSQVTGLSDRGTAITAQIHLPSRNQGDARRLKRYQEWAADLDQGGIAVILQALYNAEGVAGEFFALGAASGRGVIARDVVGGDGYLAQSFALSLLWSSDIATARLYGWESLWTLDALTRTAWYVAPTAHGLTGYQHVRDAWLTYNSTVPVTLTVTVDGTAYAYSLPTTAGLDREVYLVCQPVKGRLFGYTLSATQPFRLYPDECRVRIGPWGLADGYQVLRPFAPEFGGRDNL